MGCKVYIVHLNMHLFWKYVIDQHTIFILKQISSVQFQIIPEPGLVKIILYAKFINFETKYSFWIIYYPKEPIGNVFCIYIL